MILPQFIPTSEFREPSLTEPGQAVTLKDIVYRVSRGGTTGLSSIPLDYGEDDPVDDANYNGCDVDYIDAANDMINLSQQQSVFRSKLNASQRRASKKKEQKADSEQTP